MLKTILKSKRNYVAFLLFQTFFPSSLYCEGILNGLGYFDDLKNLALELYIKNSFFN